MKTKTSYIWHIVERGQCGGSTIDEKIRNSNTILKFRPMGYGLSHSYKPVYHKKNEEVIICSCITLIENTYHTNARLAR
jgi:hypothetical protein